MWSRWGYAPPMEASLCLLSGIPLTQVQPVLQLHSVKAAAMHPGVRDATLTRWFVLTASDEASLSAAVTELQGHPGVEAAYIKPAGEAPD